MTKQHRQSLTREKTQTKPKRPPPTDGVGESSKRSKTEEVVRSSILPAGFFSNGSGPKIVAEEDDEEEEAEGDAPATTVFPSRTTVPASGPAPGPAAAGSSTTTAVSGQTGDVELDDFLASLAEPDPEPTPAAETSTTGNASKPKTPSVIKKTNASYKDVIPGQASYEAAPVRNVPQEENVEESKVEGESEAEKRAREAKEEREEMMDRLDEETRAQYVINSHSSLGRRCGSLS